MMKKILCAVLCMMCLSLTACGEQQPVNNEEKTEENVEGKQETEEEKQESEPEDEGTAPEEEKDKPEEDEQKNTQDVKIYYVNSTSGELDSQVITLTSLDAQLIMDELQKMGVVEEGVQALSVEVNEEDKSMVLDVNEKFGDRFRSVGTTEEGEIIKAITYTYLDAYQCDKIKVTEEGKDLESGHKVYNKYLEKK